MAPITSIGALWDRIGVIATAQGFRRALQPFDFDLMPDGMLDQSYHLSSERASTQGYLGGDQAEQHSVSIYICRRIKKDAWGAARQLKVDLDALEAVLVTDYANYDYVVVDDGIQSDIRDPGLNEDFVVGRLTATVDFDRIM